MYMYIHEDMCIYIYIYIYMYICIYICITSHRIARFLHRLELLRVQHLHALAVKEERRDVLLRSLYMN